METPREHMTPADYRQLDALVAEHIFGWTRTKTKTHIWHEPVSRLWKPIDDITVLPHYSTRIDAAWQIADVLAFAYPQLRFERAYAAWYAKVWKFDDTVIGASAPTVPHALCLLALKTVHITVEEPIP